MERPFLINGARVHASPLWRGTGCVCERVAQRGSTLVEVLLKGQDVMDCTCLDSEGSLRKTRIFSQIVDDALRLPKGCKSQFSPNENTKHSPLQYFNPPRFYQSRKIFESRASRLGPPKKRRPQRPKLPRSHLSSPPKLPDQSWPDLPLHPSIHPPHHHNAMKRYAPFGVSVPRVRRNPYVKCSRK